MIEICERVWVGDQNDYEFDVRRRQGWSVVHACKEPYHRQSVGYAGRSCSPSNPEYLMARRGNRLMLNLADVPNPAWIQPAVIDAALAFIDERLAAGDNVLIHCNQGRSRSAVIGLLYLSTKERYGGLTFLEAEEDFKRLYPPYAPAGGMRGYCLANWGKYRN